MKYFSFAQKWGGSEWASRGVYKKTIKKYQEINKILTLTYPKTI